MKLSASTLAFSGHDFETACAGIAACGYAYVEPAFIEGYGVFSESDLSVASAARLLAAIRNAGAACRSVSAHVDLGQADAVEKVARRLDFASTLGARYLIANAAWAGSQDLFAANVEQVAARAQDHGVVICIENPGHGDNLFKSAEAMASWKRRFAHPFIDLNYDFGNIFTANDERVDPADDMTAVAPTAAHFHVKDVLSDASGWRMCAIGKGSLGFDRILPRLARLQPNAALSVEMPLRLSRPGRGPAVFEDPATAQVIAAALKDSLDFIERWFRPDRAEQQTQKGA